MTRTGQVGIFLIIAGLWLSGCSTTAGSVDGSAVDVVIGYQSKTVDTVTAGTLLRDRGTFESMLTTLGEENGKHYRVTWQDYDSGAPITTQMLAGKVDIGSMGDFPLLINASATVNSTNNRTEMVAITAYNSSGGLNGIVTPTSSNVTSLDGLKGQTVSTSVGSAGYGLLIRALTASGIDPGKDVVVENQSPSVGASAIRANTVTALAQFAPWPGQLVFQGSARLLFDGATTKQPTFHGVVVRAGYAAQHPEVIQAFLTAVSETTDYLHSFPLQAAINVANSTGLPAEVLYLYNGPNGIASFDMTIKTSLVDALQQDIPLLQSVQPGINVDLASFINDTYVRNALGTKYDDALVSTRNQASLLGPEEVPCGNAPWEASLASEVWFSGEEVTHQAQTPTCLLRLIRSQQDHLHPLASYVPDSVTGTRWFAADSIWIWDPHTDDTQCYKPFATDGEATAYMGSHPGSQRVTFEQALARA